MLINEIYKKVRSNIGQDRIGPDVPLTHWRLHIKSRMLRLCKQKFKKFTDNSDFRPGAYAVGCSKIEIGSRVIIRPGTKLFGETRSHIDCSIKINDDVMIGSGVHIYVHNHKFDRTDLPLIDQGFTEDKPVILKRGCWIGANAIILPGVIVGENAVVGAGSVVTKSVEPFNIVGGSPAKVIKVMK